MKMNFKILSTPKSILLSLSCVLSNLLYQLKRPKRWVLASVFTKGSFLVEVNIDWPILRALYRLYKSKNKIWLLFFQFFAAVTYWYLLVEMQPQLGLLDLNHTRLWMPVLYKFTSCLWFWKKGLPLTCSVSIARLESELQVYSCLWYLSLLYR